MPDPKLELGVVVVTDRGGILGRFFSIRIAMSGDIAILADKDRASAKVTAAEVRIPRHGALFGDA